MACEGIFESCADISFILFYSGKLQNYTGFIKCVPWLLSDLYVYFELHFIILQLCAF